MKKTDLIVYVGGAGARGVTRAEWAAAGVQGQEGVWWNAGNNYQVPVGDFNKQALELLLGTKNEDELSPGVEFRVMSTEVAQSESPADAGKDNAR